MGSKKWDADRIRTETSMCVSLTSGGGGHKNSEIAGTAFYFLRLLYTKKGK